MWRTIIRSVNTFSASKVPLRLRKMRACYGPVPVQRFIEKETVITAPPCTPEVLLHLLDSTSPHYSFNNPCDTKIPGVKNLYWAHYFPDMMCLTRYILDNAKKFSNKSVLDFSAGCGAVGIALLMSRCKYVILNEPCLACGCAAKVNALINGMPMGRFIVFPESLLNHPIKEDIVMLGEPKFGMSAEQFEKWIIQLHEKNKIVYAARTNYISGDEVQAEDIENQRVRHIFVPIYDYKLPKTMSVTWGIECVTIYQMKL